jgi:hypothetical protein
MMDIREATAILLLAFVWAAPACAGGRPQAVAPAAETISPPVCYSLHLESWHVLTPKGREIAGPPPQPEEYWLPPTSILLDAAPPTAEEKSRGWLVDATAAVRPNGTASPHWMFEVGGWQRYKGQILVLWRGGYVVTSLKFPALTQLAKGTLEVHSDDLRAPVPTCAVTLEQVPCSERAGPG